MINIQDRSFDSKFVNWTMTFFSRRICEEDAENIFKLARERRVITGSLYGRMCVCQERIAKSTDRVQQTSQMDRKS